MKKRESRCPNGTRKFAPLGEGCHKNEDIKSYEENKGSKTRKNKKAIEKEQSVLPLSKVALNAVPLNAVPLNAVPLNAVPLSREPLIQEPLIQEPLNEVPLSKESLIQEPLIQEPLNEVPLSKEPLGQVPLNAVPLVDDSGLISPDEGETVSENEQNEYYTNLKRPSNNNDFLYPSLDDPYFNKRISLRKEFKTMKYDGTVKPNIKEISNLICKNSEFEMMPHQQFVKNFLSKQTPYNSILLYHGLGSGKTCSAIGIAEEMRDFMKQTGISQRILVVASSNVQENFKLQLFDGRKLVENKDGSWSISTCVGTKYLNEINPTKSKMEREKITTQAKAIINANYIFMGYLQFANFIEDKIASKMSVNQSATEKELIKKFFSNRLIIIDEVHNCKENKTLSKQLKKIAKHADNLRFVFLSATPMYNSQEEIIWITNLMNLNDGKSLIKYEDVFNPDGTMIDGSKGEDIGRNLLRRKLNGYVSYVRGENPYTFPFRVYPKDFLKNEKKEVMPKYPSLQMKGQKPFQPLVLLKEKLYLSEIEEKQRLAYQFIIKKSLEIDDGWTPDTTPDHENMDTYGYTKLQAPLQALIMTFHHNDFDDIVNENYDNPVEYKKLYGKDGLNNCMSHETKTDSTGAVPVTTKYNYEYKKGVPRMFNEEFLSEYSSKLSKVCDCIRKSVLRTVDIEGKETEVHGGIIIVYTQYIEGGIIPMALALEEMGFERHGGVSLFREGFIETKVDAKTLRPKNQVPFDEFKQAKYIILSGDQYFSQNNAEDIKYATSKENKYGENVRVILISKAASEGVDFKFVRQIHILEPWYNLNRIEQIIGRGVRNRSHCGLLFEERNTEIYLHAATNGERETTDIYVYRYAENKAKNIGQVTRLLKTVSVDCKLNHAQTNFTTDDMKVVGEVSIVSSTMLEPQPYELGDKPFSEVCDYMENCKYDCYPENSDTKITKPEVNETYNKEYISMNSERIMEKIKEMYKNPNSQNAYHYDTIKGFVFKIEKEDDELFNKEELYYALTQLMNPAETMIDKYGRPGRLINKGLYYIFQPSEVTENNITLYESTIPVKSHEDRVRYEILPKAQITTPDLNLKQSGKQGKDKQRKEEEREEIKEEEEEPRDDKYDSMITKMNEKITMATKEQPNIILWGNDNDDWYLNINSIRDRKNKAKSGLFVSVMIRLILHGIDTELLTKLTVEHFLDTLPFEDRSMLAKIVSNPSFKPQTPLDNHIYEYFQYLTFTSTDQTTTAILLMKDDTKTVLYNVRNWNDISEGDIKYFFEKQIRDRLGVSIENMSDNIGFVNMFKDKDGSVKPVFKIRNLKKGSSNGRDGSYLQQENKIVIVSLINAISKEAGSPFSYDNENQTEPSRNTDDITKYAFAGIAELLFRKFNLENINGKKWFLRPEEAIYNKVWTLKRS
jgi:superfamily II DNA or RNA helicase